MKKSLYLLLAAFGFAGLILSGCATGKNSAMTIPPVGPSADVLASANPTNGTLVVYTAYKRNADFSMRDNYRPEYSDYQVLDADGKSVRHVHNNSGNIFQDVVSIALEPGRYSVVARANGYGYLTIPVVIEAQHGTVLHLEGGNSWA